MSASYTLQMQFFILSLILLAVTSEYMEKLGIVPKGVSYLLEMFGALALLYFIALGVRSQFRFVRSIYWLVFGALVLDISCGILLNGVEAGPIFAGLRNYLRAIPFFLLPAAFAFSEPQVRKQMMLILLLCLVQLPVVLYQRTLPGVTGDAISGTLMISSFMSLFLICSACVITAFYVRNRLNFWTYLLLLALVLASATLNETKGTLLFLPVGVLVTFWLGSRREGPRFGKALALTGSLAAFIAIFVAVYDYTQKDVPYHTGLVAFFEEGAVKRYLTKDAGLGARKERSVGRLDALKVPLEYLAQDAVHLTFGYGIGNVSDSALGLQFKGEYFRLFAPFLQLTAARLMLEAGMFGLALVLWLLALILLDCRKVAAVDSGLYGTLAQGWGGVTVVITMAMFYKDLLPSGALSFLFWYFSGLVAARRMRLAVAAETPHIRPQALLNATAVPVGKRADAF